MRWCFSRFFKADYRFASNQWETSLQSNAVSHWLGASLDSALNYSWWQAPLWCHKWMSRGPHDDQFKVMIDVPATMAGSMNKKLSMWKHRKWGVESTKHYVMGVLHEYHNQSWCKTLQLHKFVTLHACVRNLDDEIYIAHYISIWCITGCFQIELRSLTGSWPAL